MNTLVRGYPLSPVFVGPGFRRDDSSAGALRQLDLHVHAGGEVELHQRVDRLRGRLHDVEQPFVRPHLELLARLLVDVRRAVDGELLDARRQRNGPANESTRAPRRVGDVASGLVEHSMIERLQANADILRFHNLLTDCKEPAQKGEPNKTDRTLAAPVRPNLVLKRRAARICRSGRLRALYYFVISATTPAPTVRPPSRMAKRRPWSIAIGAMSLTPRFTLSPGITISVPSGRTTSPVTSVVRK